VAKDAIFFSVTSSQVTILVESAPSSTFVTITSPNNGSSFPNHSTVMITAKASTTYGNVTRVNFYYNGVNLLCSTTTSPYTCTVGNTQTGWYALTAVAKYANGVSVTSKPVDVTILST
jgi:hypothetical protein